MSQEAVTSEVSTNLPEVGYHSQTFREDSPCPACGQICPNDAYCVNCGFVYDPLLKKYMVHWQTDEKEAKNKKPGFMANRNPDGSYRDLPSTKHTKKHELMLKMGDEFKRQNGRAAKLGDVLRQKNLDGSYNKSSGWYIFAPSGWVKSPSKKRKPTKAQIKRVSKNPKKGR